MALRFMSAQVAGTSNIYILIELSFISLRGWVGLLRKDTTDGATTDNPESEVVEI